MLATRIPFVPLDAVVQTQEKAFVYVVDSKNVARAKKVTLGNIQGRYVEIPRACRRTRK